MANRRDKVLLEGAFSMYPSKRSFNVTLTSGALYYRQISVTKSRFSEKAVHMSDIIGCHCSLVSNTSQQTGQVNGKPNASRVTVFAYPFQRRILNGSKARCRVTVTFEIDSSADYPENKRTALKWKNVINCLARGFHVQLTDVERCEPPSWGKFLVLVNPCSGQGKAMKIFKNEVEPMLGEAGIPFKLCVTEYAGQANELLKSMDLSEWAAVVVVSGDGLIYEVINGLMQRVDWSAAIKKPIGCVPGGSGNALACSINYAAGEPVTVKPVLHSTFVLIKHRVIPMDLILVQTPSKQCYSFLSVTWGLIADADCETENYRFLGEARFTIGAVKSIVNMPGYEGKLSFLPVAEYVSKKSKEAAGMKRGSSISSQDSSRYVLPTSTDQKSCDNGCLSIDAAMVCNNSNCASGQRISLSDLSVQTFFHAVNDSSKGETESIKSSVVCAATDQTTSSAAPVKHVDSEEGAVEVDEGGDSAAPRLLLPPLDQPVSEDWVVVTGRFIMVCAIFQTHLGSDLLMAPFARLSDGIIHLMFVREGISRYRLYNVLQSLSKGTHIDSPDVEFVSVLAFRLEPEENRSHIMVDGERMDPMPVQGQVLPGVGRIMAIQ